MRSCRSAARCPAAPIRLNALAIPLAGRVGIVDLNTLDPTLAGDFTASARGTPDKTYTLLCGRVGEADDVGVVPGFTDEELRRLPAVGRFFARTLAQCLAGLGSPLPPAQRIHCLIWATADGSRELDEALVPAAVDHAARTTGAPVARDRSVPRRTRDDVRAPAGLGGRAVVLPRVPPRRTSTARRRDSGSRPSMRRAPRRCIRWISGIDALRDGRCDVAICGGAFAPGPASTCLFAQFQGLSATGSRPLDATADGVVFGEGAALFVLKRLPDAVVAGDSDSRGEFEASARPATARVRR